MCGWVVAVCQISYIASYRTSEWQRMGTQFTLSDHEQYFFIISHGSFPLYAAENFRAMHVFYLPYMKITEQQRISGENFRYSRRHGWRVVIACWINHFFNRLNECSCNGFLAVRATNHAKLSFLVSQQGDKTPSHRWVNRVGSGSFWGNIWSVFCVEKNVSNFQAKNFTYK